MVVLARWLGPEEYGVITFLLSVTTLFLLFVDFGISPSLARLLAKREDESAHLLRTGLLLLAGTGLVTTTLFYTFRFSLADIAKASSLEAFALSVVGLILARVVYRFLGKAYEGIREMAIYSKMLLVLDWLPWAGAVALTWYYGSTAGPALTGYLVGFLIVDALIGARLVFLVRGSASRQEGSVRQDATEIASYALPLFFTHLSFYVYAQSDILLIQYFMEERDVGIYGIAIRLIDALHVPAIAIGSTVGAYFVNASQERAEGGSLSERARLLLQSTQGVLALYLPVCVGLWFTAESIVDLLFGPEFITAASVAVIYIPFLLSKAVANTYSQALDYLGFARTRAVAAIVSALANIALNIFLIPRFGLTGAALSTQITFIPLVIWYIFMLSRICDVSWGELFRWTRPVIYATLVMTGVLAGARFADASLLTMITIGVLSYVAAAYVAGLIPPEMIDQAKQRLSNNS
jgi:O-antigen/teichoic acid export membrane protein